MSRHAALVRPEPPEPPKTPQTPPSPDTPASPSARRIAASTAEPAWRRSAWLTAPEVARYASSEPRRNWMALAPDVSPAIAYPVSPMPSIAVTARYLDHLTNDEAAKGLAAADLPPLETS